MSTKTTFKRIALVAVASLGFGVLSSVAPAGAADADSTYTKSLSFNTTSITSVGEIQSDETENAAIFKITANGDGGVSHELFATESITASVSAVPTSVYSTYTMGANKADLQLQFLSGTGYGASFSTTGTANSGGGAALVATSATSSVDKAAIAADKVTPSTDGVYYLAVAPGNGKTAAMDSGFYTIQVRLQDISGFITNYSLKVQFVSSAADSGAVITPSVSGQFVAGTSATYTATKAVSATVKDANGGLIQVATIGTAFAPTSPAVTAALVNGTTGLPRSETVTGYDNGALNNDTRATALVAGTNQTASDRNAADVILKTGDGSYGFTISTLGAATATDGDTLRVRYGASSTSVAFTITPAATGSTIGAGSFTATGKIAGASANAVTLPVTTKSVTFNNKVTLSDVAQTGYNVYYTLAYGTSCVLADMSPAKSATPVKLVTDSTGVASLTVTNANPLNGCTASVVWSGAATNPGVASGDPQVATWATAAATTALPSTGDYQAKLGSTNTVTWVILDQFGAAVAGKTVKFSLAGANAPTSGVATATTSATGSVSLTWTDAKAVADETDTVSITAVGTDAPTGSAVEVTYKSALSVVDNIRATYGASDVLVSTTSNIGSTTGIAIGEADQLDLTSALTNSASANAPWVKLTFTARTSANVAVSGVPTTVTVTGAKLIGADGKLATTKVVYDNSAVYVLGTTTGVATVTATNGTVTSKATIYFVNTKDQDERVVSATESNGVVTVSVKDAFGNAVSSASLDVTTTGGAVIGASTYGSYKTAADGTVSFNVTGAGSVTAKLVAAQKTGKLANSGDIYGLVSTPGAPAGVRSATVATNGVTQAVDVAQAATDAAAEATDAANAATDAANAAAEAADAATAAAQDAADAVAALSTQVTEMVSALKKQITALTNLVIKIQKKVKA